MAQMTSCSCHHRSVACAAPAGGCMTSRQQVPSTASCISHISLRPSRLVPNATDSTCQHFQRRPQTTRTGAMGSQVVQEWADLATASSDETYVAEEDPVFQDDINRLCNVGLKAMLRDERREVSEWQDELNKYGSHFGDEGNRDAAIFIYTLYQMSEHKLPTESLQLSGMYLRAFEKMFNVLEDSGWALKRGDDSDASSSDDDDFQPLLGM